MNPYMDDYPTSTTQLSAGQAEEDYKQLSKLRALHSTLIEMAQAITTLNPTAQEQVCEYVGLLDDAATDTLEIVEEWIDECLRADEEIQSGRVEESEVWPAHC